MAKRCFKIIQHDTKGEPFRFGSIAWDAVLQGSTVVLRRYGKETSIKLDGVKPGDYIWVDCCGRNTAIGFAKVPKDPRLLFLWKKYFRKSTRVFDSNVEKIVYEELGGDWKPSWYENGYTEGSWRMVGLNYNKTIRPNKEVAFFAISGRINNTNDTITRWYMAPDATLQEVREAFGYKQYPDEVYDDLDLICGNHSALNAANHIYIRETDNTIRLVKDGYDEAVIANDYNGKHYTNLIAEADRDPHDEHGKWRREVFDSIVKRLKVQ
ncbi:MAG: hypothetical protein IJ880_15885 [Bacilli bacterium]|nr:hypothetical protein [Bacilli bacterium]